MVRVLVTAKDGVDLPSYMTDQAAGMDIRAHLPDGRVTINPGTRHLIPGGFSLAIPSGYEVQIRPRSGIALRSGVTVLNAPGTIDADYRGEIGVLLINHGASPFTIRNGDRIAQMVLARVERACLVVVTSDDFKLSGTQRGVGGFGSTGAE